METGTVLLSVRVQPVVREMIRQLSMKEDRNLSGWVSAIARREFEAAKLELQDSFFEDEKSVKRSKTIEDQAPILAAGEFGPWAEFVEMRRTCKKPGHCPLTMRAAQHIIKQLYRAEEMGWDIDELLEEAIAREWMVPVFEQHLKKKG